MREKDGIGAEYCKEISYHEGVSRTIYVVLDYIEAEESNKNENENENKIENY